MYLRLPLLLFLALSVTYGTDFDDAKVACTQKEYAKAFVLFRKACDAKHPEACYRLGKMYELGRGTPKDSDKAERLYKKACIQLKNQEACDELEALEDANKVGC